MSQVDGLFVFHNFLTPSEETELVGIIDDATQSVWLSNRSKTRRVQMFGPKHNSDYKISRHAEITPLPKYVAQLAPKIARLLQTEMKNNKACTQVTAQQLANSEQTELFVNEYKINDELQFHTDHRSTYLEPIVGISLLSECVLSFRKGRRIERAVIPRNSVYIMTGASRYDWQHGIERGNVKGERRVSLTFRLVDRTRLC